MDRHLFGADPAPADRPVFDPERSVYPRLYAVHRDAENLLAGINRNHPRLMYADLERIRHELDQAQRAIAFAQPEPTDPARAGQSF